MKDGSYFTDFGLKGITRIPYGLHACHFYLHRDQLVAALVPYFVAGLRANERCLWITAPPLPAAQAREALAVAWPETDAAIARGALRILDFDAWYTSSAGLKGSQVADLWLREEEKAIADGYRGLRITGNTSFLHAETWPIFMEYERGLSSRLNGRRIVTLCSYSMDKCGAPEVMDVMRAHPCILDHDGESWQILSGR